MVPKIRPGNIYVHPPGLVSSVCAIEWRRDRRGREVARRRIRREVVAEMLAQAEHNPDSVAILVTPSAELLAEFTA